MFRLLFRWLPKSVLTRLAGWLACRRRPRLLISAGIRLYRWHYRIDMGDFAEPEGGFVTFNEFFARPLKPGRRPVDAAADGIVSPVDGGIGMAGTVVANRAIQAKGLDYSLEALLGGDPGWAAYDGGAYLTLYLSPRDYHRIHSPVAGAVTRYRYLPGESWPVNAPAVRSVPRLYTRNERLVTYLSGSFGEMALVAVGAMIVGRIRVVYDAGIGAAHESPGQQVKLPQPFPVAKGTELGRFELGSSVILLFRRGEANLLDLPPGGTVRMGEAIGSLNRGIGTAPE